MKNIFFVDIGIGILMIVIAIPMILEKIKPNIFYGFKTKKTLSDEKIWYPANKYAGKVMVGTGIAISILALLTYILMDRNIIPPIDEVTLTILWCGILFVPIIIMLILSFAYLRKL